MKAIALIFLTLASLSIGLADADPRQAQNDDIREAVFRYLLEHRSDHQRETAPIYFFAVAEKEEPDQHNPNGLLPFSDERNNPSDNLMRRFQKNKPPIEKNSAFQRRSPGDSNPGVRFRVTGIKWISDTEVEVKGGHDDAWSVSWSHFTVKKQNGKWKVTKAELKRVIVA